jgi:single-stranded DNA-binding protein
LLEVERLSGAVDVLPVIVPEAVLDEMDVTDGSMLAVTGQLRSFNSRAQTGRRLVISAYAESLQVCDGYPENRVSLTGTVCRPPVFRRTPLGREICDVMLAVDRPYGRSDYLPCIFWGRTAAMASACAVGDLLTLTGRFQSREYIKVLEDHSECRTAYEISAMTGERVE